MSMLFVVLSFQGVVCNSSLYPGRSCRAELVKKAFSLSVENGETSESGKVSKKALTVMIIKIIY